MSTKNWIGDLHKGGLHKALGVPMGETIPPSKVASAVAKGGRIAKMARTAQTLAKLRKRA